MNNLKSKKIILTVSLSIFSSQFEYLIWIFFLKKQYLETSMKNQDDVAEDKS